uniref:Uncharacterized protein n=1 Tax=Dictyoglomus turgidum TaxID=513050 RepID=A0A7C3SN67_9BACT
MKQVGTYIRRYGKSKLGLCHVRPNGLMRYIYRENSFGLPSSHSIFLERIYSLKGINYGSFSYNFPWYSSIFQFWDYVNANYFYFVYPLKPTQEIIVFLRQNNNDEYHCTSGFSHEMDRIYSAALLDRGSDRLSIFTNGEKVYTKSSVKHPDFSANFKFVIYECHLSFTILFRITVLSSVPSDFDAAVKRMWEGDYYKLDKSIADKVDIIASQYDFTQDVYGLFDITTIKDTGIIGGFDARLAGLPFSDRIRIVEKV